MRNAKEVPRNKKMRLDEVLSFSFSSLIKERAANGQWMLMGLIVTIINLLPVGVLASGMNFNSNFSIWVQPERYFENISGTTVATASILLLIAGLVDLVFMFYSTAWFMRLGLDAYDLQKRSFKERFNLAFKDLGRLIGPMILLVLFSIVVMMPYFVTNVMSKMNPSTQLAGVSLLLEFLYYIIIYFVMVKIACMYGLMLDRKMRFVEALKTSIQMVKGRGWRILGYYLLIALLSFILIIILCIIPSILWTVTFVTGFAPAMIGLSVLVSVVVYTLMLCIQSAISGNLQMAIYRYLEIEHSEDEIVEAPGTTFDSTEKSDENDLKF